MGSSRQDLSFLESKRKKGLKDTEKEGERERVGEWGMEGEKMGERGTQYSVYADLSREMVQSGLFKGVSVSSGPQDKGDL